MFAHPIYRDRPVFGCDLLCDKMKDPRNCLIFAYRMWKLYGGSVTARQSPNGWWPHFWWCDDITGAMWEYTPEFPQLGRKYPPPVYDGVIKVRTRHDKIDTYQFKECLCPNM